MEAKQGPAVPCNKHLPCKAHAFFLELAQRNPLDSLVLRPRQDESAAGSDAVYGLAVAMECAQQRRPCVTLCEQQCLGLYGKRIGMPADNGQPRGVTGQL
eukprot:1161942-Pelagomonas_calceolata.AAC.12